MLTIATWNVNSIKARLANVLEWLRANQPDIVLLQEIKCEAPAFPALEFEDLGYNIAVAGQKTYNGVALLSKRPIEDIILDLPGAPILSGQGLTQARYVAGTVAGIRFASVYVPNGNPVGEDRRSDKYLYKLAWLDALYDHTADSLRIPDQPLVIGGDYNVIPGEEDCYDPAAWAGDALFLLETRRRFRALLHLGLTDALRALHPTLPAAYTFWDYQGRAWDADNGIRIDHLLLSPEAADRLDSCVVDRDARGRPKASDHTPVVMAMRD